MNIGSPSFQGIYQLVPPIVGGWSIKRPFKKIGKGVKKIGKGVKKIAVKTAMGPVILTRYGAKAVAKIAAKPIAIAVSSLARRRARYIAWQRRNASNPTNAEKKEGVQYAFKKLQQHSPLGKMAVRILRYTGGVTAGQDTSMCGMSGAEILAVAAAVTAAVKKISAALNKPGEAPANPKIEASEPDDESES